MTSTRIEPGAWVLLYSPDRKTYLIAVATDQTLSTHHGQLRHNDMIGKAYGDVIFSSLGTPYFLLEPTLEDRMMKVKRMTQIIYPKDAGLILIKTGVGPGMRVIECGAGSGSSTLALAHAVAPHGRVYVYERDERFLKNARLNVERAGFADLVEYKTRDVSEGFDEQDVDVVLLDLPAPWEGVQAAARALRGGGRLASLSPTYNQIERMVEALDQAGFVMIETVELLLRHILARRGKTRPFERMISHTGFLTFARKAVRLSLPVNQSQPEPENNSQLDESNA
ncbi:MAG: tRNA (adenine-N1)-methyltransferase [Acidobacteriota bacterium]|nr:tRNA (adenine-N1)-methyltransferase [Blastocatellia bacterium]MDW8240123.1 tRNA (adenine-N1)-methyltransferase [Acidobacteriota bacterium]